MTPAEIAALIVEARTRTLELVADLSDEELRVEKIPIVNPLDWEIGHVAHFQELFALRQVDGRAPLRADGDSLYDSIAIDHDVRWDLPLPPRSELCDYLARVRDDTAAAASRADVSPAARYRQLLTVFHEDMHDEAFTYTRQTMAYRAPELSLPRVPAAPAGSWPGDAVIAGGRFALGSPEPRGGGFSQDDMRFCLDNEQWAHTREVAPFAIARAPVTQIEYAAFVDDGGYTRRALWSDEGWRWREALGPAVPTAAMPLYWRRGAGWERRHFDRWVALEPHQPVIHVCWHEAQAYCAWAGRRLPTELEWEVAAAGVPDEAGRLRLPESGAPDKRHYPWGDEPPTAERVNMDWAAMGCIDVAALPAGDSAFGCRQMLGNVWEWCSDTFQPYPGFVAGPYKEYSAPLFGSTKVLRGGCWVTRSRLIRNTWRNYYEPHRRDVWAGFRTCAA